MKRNSPNSSEFFYSRFFVIASTAIIALSVFNACSNNEPDFRNPYTGTFEFKTILNGIEMCYDSSESCIDGWTVYFRDTTYFTSEVELYQDNRLKIQFGEEQLGIFNDSIVHETFYPIVSAEGELTFPELMNSCGRFFNGRFNGYDEIEMNFQYSCGIGIYFEYYVTGVRKR